MSKTRKDTLNFLAHSVAKAGCDLHNDKDNYLSAVNCGGPPPTLWFKSPLHKHQQCADLCFKTNLKQKGKKNPVRNKQCFVFKQGTQVLLITLTYGCRHWCFVPLGSGDQKNGVHNFHIKLFSFNDKKTGKDKRIKC